MRRTASVVAVFVLLLLQLGARPARQVALRPCCCEPVAADATPSKASCCAQPTPTRVRVRAGGGMFTVVRIRDGITGYDDPPPYEPPRGTLAAKVSG